MCESFVFRFLPSFARRKAVSTRNRAQRSFESKAAEYFWLCKPCSVVMTLRLTQDGRVMATGLRKAIRNGLQPALISVNRETGLLLRRVSFLRSNHPSVT